MVLKRWERCLAVPEVGHAVITSCWLQLCTVLGWVHTCNVTAYRNTVSWQCGRDSCPRNVSKVCYAITLRACSVCCRYLAVAWKGWYGYGRSGCGRAALHVSADVFAHHQELLTAVSTHSRHQPAATWVNTTRCCKYSQYVARPHLLRP